MTTITCFWVEESADCELALRRYVSLETKLADHPYGYCNETVSIGRAPTRKDERGFLTFIRPKEFETAPWPIACSVCGREFGPLGDGVSRIFTGLVNDQVNQEPIYRSASGEEWPMNRLPPGAMFDAIWHHREGGWLGPDGVALVVVCPYPGSNARSGFWHVDGPASNSDAAWDRTGDPRTSGSVTANPSIRLGDYHGWLRSGTLVQC